ncbi:threonylcarbamoyladenosine tRNA methylthiotransferase MtaB [Lachnospiraceae bacterium KH1T2]|nr:threonylcarbamoyladenosine tRNA methylthiotransferase MtaB [Lachnospiraceae bacterium KH1T2]
MKSAALHNLGCKVNAYELEIMQNALEEDGYNIVPFDEKADIYVINTCSVTNIADRKSRQMLHKARTMNPNAIVVAAGCYVNTRGDEEVLNDDVDIVISNNDKKEIAHIIDKYVAEHPIAETIYAAEPLPVNTIEASATRRRSQLEGDHTRAFVKIQDGCEMFCSYCIIPYARGVITSRPEEDIIAELTGLVAEGYHEFVLTGIHLSSYGVDRMPSDKNKSGHLNFAEFIDGYRSGKIESPLVDLIERLSKIDGIDRIRLGSLEPRIITEEFAKRLSAIPEICPQFHLSLQSGCDSVLRRMNRHYTSEEYLDGVNILRQYFGSPAITTDVIVGFPQETEAEFEETHEFLKRVNFYETHIFKYSRRQGTPADKMDGQLTDAQKHVRSTVLLALNAENKRKFADSFVGRDVEVLFEENNEGYTKEYVRVKAVDKEYATGTIVKGRITGRLNDDIMIFE